MPGCWRFQRYDVSRWIEDEDTVVCQAEWHAELAKDAGPLRRGQRLHTYSVLIFTFRDDKIIRQEAYDCYEPFENRLSLSKGVTFQSVLKSKASLNHSRQLIINLISDW